MQCLACKLLHAVFAKEIQAERGSLRDNCRRTRLRYGHQLDLGARAASPPAGLHDLLFQPFKIRFERRHRSPGRIPPIAPASKLIMWTIVLLIFSNIFMTFAWYGHLKFRQEALWKVILISWGIALFEYCFQVPANRIGAGRFSPVQLKVIQEIITLVVFGVFVTFYFGQHLRWNHAAAGVCLVAAAFFVFHSW